MPDVVTSSPTLAPDGTLFVMCGDKNLYAFRDPPACPADIDGSGGVDLGDLLAILIAWGPCGHPSDCPEDLDGDGVVAFRDILIVLAAWGLCPELERVLSRQYPTRDEDSGRSTAASWGDSGPLLPGDWQTVMIETLHTSEGARCPSVKGRRNTAPDERAHA